MFFTFPDFMLHLRQIHFEIVWLLKKCSCDYVVSKFGFFTFTQQVKRWAIAVLSWCHLKVVQTTKCWLSAEQAQSELCSVRCCRFIFSFSVKWKHVFEVFISLHWTPGPEALRSAHLNQINLIKTGRGFVQINANLLTD